MQESILQVFQVDVKKLRPWDHNPRINDHAVDAVVASIQEFGFNVPILCDSEHTIIAGHTRWKAAKKLGMQSVPVIRLSLDDTQRKAFSIADNKTAEIASWNLPELVDVLKELGTEEIDLSSIGFDETELAAILEPERDIDWSEFEENMMQTFDPLYIHLLVKISPDEKNAFKKAIDEYAKVHGIIEKDKGVLAGKVFRNILGVVE